MDIECAKTLEVSGGSSSDTNSTRHIGIIVFEGIGLAKHRFDTLPMAGTGNFDTYRDPPIAWLQQMRGSVRRIAAICTGKPHKTLLWLVEHLAEAIRMVDAACSAANRSPNCLASTCGLRRPSIAREYNQAEA
ncbi:hypothetical protein SAMN04515617_11484 [Collimonas sp. OK242]|uniref:hypothetical protein n=1 Tax=Collimonas sp. OK242 TaxID=1798195 RepID=UPI00089D767A|nr:hypothetical protein [Collimonas sp. OK242]SDY43138.1 hypothetical protein SAMN04515617_11484 [Collimonas sp. OK242]